MFIFTFEDIHSLPHFAAQWYPVNNQNIMKTGDFLVPTISCTFSFPCLLPLKILFHPSSILAYRRFKHFSNPSSTSVSFEAPSYSLWIGRNLSDIERLTYYAQYHGNLHIYKLVSGLSELMFLISLRCNIILGSQEI